MKSVIVTCLTSMLMTGAALAQASSAAPPPAPAATTSAAALAAAKKTPVRTAKSLECSKEADTKGLHGKPRKHFMSTCKKA